MSLKEGNSEMRLSGAAFLKGAVDDFHAGKSSALSSGSSPALTVSVFSTPAFGCSTFGNSSPVCGGHEANYEAVALRDAPLSSRGIVAWDRMKCESSLFVKLQASSGLSGTDSEDIANPLVDLSDACGTDALSELREEHQHVSSVASEKPLTLHDVPESVLYGAIPYLSLPDVIALSRTCKKFHKLVQGYFAVNEHGVMSIPAFDTRSFMQYRPERKPPVTKVTAAGPAPKIPGVKPIRLFFGQQRRDVYPSALRRLLRFIAPDLVITHMEAHVNEATGRGKGCAWVIVPSVLEAKRLLRLSGRIFLDINSNGEEVYLFAPPNCREWLSEYADYVVSSTTRASHLPYLPMVVGVPKKECIYVRELLAPYIYDPNRGDCPPYADAVSEFKGLLEDHASLPVSSAVSGIIPPFASVPPMVQTCMFSSSFDRREYFEAPNVYTSTVWTGFSRYRHDPYVFDPLREPTNMLPLHEVDYAEM
ncbi:hypothetical protein, conserved [Trypanosoma brucei gambiense DAL972]|uniref:F-box domain-containing protein n=1 Tax=Trypanosoma brucei gambiense (strain MHOM/CI/86/DAL972) TaxID=679716 RepID=C9ZI31_TRYB9|nr:hypothetical protein, conserved [Trypanosoma brucei gambiense DAL972]CBH09148.1 hypothetical protein, conserved [Trypanosoma brucei gambiense DAL972]|eukprot:XP_011771589.1 hypothetical protein, conserved [Trypanosoma brucei gambiense DAL972]